VDSKRLLALFCAADWALNQSLGALVN